MKGHDIGRGMSIVLRQQRLERDLHEDVDAYHAPSECHDLVERGLKHDRRIARGLVKAATGLKMSEFIREVRRRTTARMAHFQIGRM